MCKRVLGAHFLGLLHQRGRLHARVQAAVSSCLIYTQCMHTHIGSISGRILAAMEELRAATRPPPLVLPLAGAEPSLLLVEFARAHGLASLPRFYGYEHNEAAWRVYAY